MQIKHSSRGPMQKTFHGNLQLLQVNGHPQRSESRTLKKNVDHAFSARDVFTAFARARLGSL